MIINRQIGNQIIHKFIQNLSVRLDFLPSNLSTEEELEYCELGIKCAMHDVVGA